MTMPCLARMLAFVLLALTGAAKLFAAPNELQVSLGSDREIVLRREFAAPPQVVFDALTRPEHLVGWLRPTHLRLVACDVDLREGGSLRYTFERPGGTRIEVRGAYRVVEPPRRLVYLESYDFSPLQLLVTTALHESGDGTRVEQTLTYGSKQERDTDLGNVAPSTAQAYDELERYLRTTASPRRE